MKINPLFGSNNVTTDSGLLQSVYDGHSWNNKVHGIVLIDHIYGLCGLCSLGFQKPRYFSGRLNPYSMPLLVFYDRKKDWALAETRIHDFLHR